MANKLIMAAEGFERFLDELECPVCLLIPREGPVGACPVGHIVCKNCHENVETCPTCRRQMLKDGTNTIVNKMIEEVPHPCKYRHFGCETKQRLNELVDHESKCPERTIECPYLRCNDEVQIKKYNEHAKTNNCNRHPFNVIANCSRTAFGLKNGQSIESFLSKNKYWHMKTIKSGHLGDVRLRRLRVDVTEKVEMCVDCQRYFVGNDSLQKHLQEVHKFPGPDPTNGISNSSSSSPSKKKREGVFYLHQYFFSSEKTYAFYVTGEAEKCLAKITLKNFNDERRFLTNIQGVVSMDSAPRNENEVLASKNVMFVSWRQMSGFLKWTEEDGKQTSMIKTTVDIIDE